tara:strand:+ start:130 stop:1584 length:1455 start_codon:yes stop_codon:yes gene_type:complete
MANNRELSQFASVVGYNGGNIGIGTDSMTSALQIYAADTGEGTAKGQITLKDTAAYDQTPTGGVVFQGHHTTGAQAIFAGIRGFKANTGNGDYDGCLAFDVRKHGAVAYEAMRINEDGKIGINETTPDAQLHVKGSGAGSGLTFLSEDSSGNNTFWIQDGGKVGVHYYPFAINRDSGDTIPSGNYFYVHHSSSPFSIKNDGRVFIGTDSEISSNANAKLQIRSTSDAAQIILGRNDTTATTGESIGYLSFQGNDGGSFQECARIAAVVDANHADDDKPTRISFYVCRDNSGSISESWRLRSDGGTQNFSTSTNYDLSNTRSAGNTYEFIYARNNSGSLGTGTLAFKVTNNGNVSNTNNTYGSLSDQRLKENIVDATSQWDDIKGLQIRKYNFRENTGYETHTQIGLIAQEAESISPGLVETSAVKEGETVLDADGNQLESIKSINYSVLYMKAVKALQEAQTRIETLETQNADLLTRVTALEGS